MFTDKNSKIMNYYSSKIKTNQNNEINLYINIQNSKLFISCYYYKNYSKKTFTNSFSLNVLEKESPYYKQFISEKNLLEEIITNKAKEKEYINGNEETDEIIKLNIPTTSNVLPKLSFDLKEKKKSHEEELNEKIETIKNFENEYNIANFNSKIIGKDKERHTIKIWISPNHKLRAKLLYSFYNSGKDEKVRNFHYACDNKRKILIICKSNNEIFGGYTPLSFNSSNVYGYDNDSFLFSLNDFKKYPKSSFSKTKSIWCYNNYGPCFYYDLYFIKGTMNIIKLEKKHYLTRDNWVKRENCNFDKQGIIIESLEIFQIQEGEYNIDFQKSGNNSIENVINDDNNNICTNLNTDSIIKDFIIIENTNDFNDNSNNKTKINKCESPNLSKISMNENYTSGDESIKENECTLLQINTEKEKSIINSQKEDEKEQANIEKESEIKNIEKKEESKEIYNRTNSYESQHFFSFDEKKNKQGKLLNNLIYNEDNESNKENSSSSQENEDKEENKTKIIKFAK